MIETIQFRDHVYPTFQSQGFAAQFAFPFAQQVCKGTGYDIGCNRHAWCLPGAIPIDPLIDNRWDAYNLPDNKVDYIFSSHCLEHLRNWTEALDYWRTKLKQNGVLFLYLPHPIQQYWRPWHNRKHIHVLYPELIKDYLTDTGWKNIFVGGPDLNSSFMVMAEAPSQPSPKGKE